MNQSSNRQAPSAAHSPAAGESFSSPASAFNNGGRRGKLLRILLPLFLALALLALAYFLTAGGNSQQRAVDKDKYQAVFLNNGQVYFGKIDKINKSGVDLRGIYYLQTSSTDATQQSASNTNVSLVKLGCELHAPADQMLINPDQVLFWENIQDSGQVVKAINDYKKQNGDKQNCSQQSQNSTQQAPASSSADPTSGTATQPSTSGTGAATGTNATTPTTTTPANKRP